MNGQAKTLIVAIIMALISIKGSALALHVDLDPAKKIDFAQKRIVLMKSHIEMKQQQAQATGLDIESLRKVPSDKAMLASLEQRLAELTKEIEERISDLKVTENSIKALMTKK